MHNETLNTFDFTHDNKRFRAEVVADLDMGAPWEEHDGHGVVSDMVRRDKRPGEVCISGHEGKPLHRYYDVQATMKIAMRDGWGAPEGHFREDAKPSKREIAAAAVKADMQRMKGWCNDDWQWIGVVVFPLTADGDELRSKTESLWGIESDDPKYHAEVACELAEQIDFQSLALGD